MDICWYRKQGTYTETFWFRNEDKKSPLTDSHLAEKLNIKGYPVARRTVAKNREQLEFPVARLRRQLTH